MTDFETALHTYGEPLQVIYRGFRLVSPVESTLWHFETLDGSPLPKELEGAFTSLNNPRGAYATADKYIATEKEKLDYVQITLDVDGRINDPNVSVETRDAWDLYKTARDLADAEKEKFETLMNVPFIGTGKMLKFGYFYGKLSVALVECDARGSVAKKASSLGSLFKDAGATPPPSNEAQEEKTGTAASAPTVRRQLKAS